MIHAFNCAIAEAPPSGGVGPTEWNQTHVLGITSVSANLGLTAAHDTLFVTTGSSTVVLTLPSAVGNLGRTYLIKKVDSGLGIVSVATVSAQTIDGQPSWDLTNEYQYIEVASDGANWNIIRNN